MDEYVTPTGPDVPARDMVRRSWAATVAALPVGTRVTGKVLRRQPFGIFIRIEGVPDAVGLAEITAMPLGMELPAPRASVAGVVYWLDARNHQVRVRLDEWQADDE
ncbi:hypothetical protein [Streptomyces sp. NRRL B-3648]|uniref:hypothetical protein n=1 Tax=Streptomyces sp. NRRL B-3648 TaxID=1519493 RepID=UPI0006ADE69C|nr:hypothetical protein [Streptomyces sp. NRRL B-3648]KOX03453.1 hypothetical protein ADL04_09690 [Streptomyces sp. NRRL B-3648]